MPETFKQEQSAYQKPYRQEQETYEKYGGAGAVFCPGLCSVRAVFCRCSVSAEFRQVSAVFWQRWCFVTAEFCHIGANVWFFVAALLFAMFC